MGWFGSLGLAYKYALVFGALMFLVILAGVIKIFYNRQKLKKFTKKAELESQGGRDERVELNARELDEGDLFGIRAIQSGYYGGVAQSRPVSPVGSHSPEGSVSNTLLGSRPSPKLIATTPMSSVTALPLEARRSSPSPLGPDVMSLREGSRSMASPKRNLTPINPRLQPSEAELNGRINHDPAVNMSLDVPPSPLRATAAPSPGGSRSPSPSYPFPITGDDHHQTPSALRPGQPNEARSYTQPVSHAEIHATEIRSQSGSIVSRSTTDDVRRDGRRSPHQEYQSPYEEYRDLPARPLQSAQIDRPMSNESYYPPRSSSVPRSAPPRETRQPGDQVSIPTAPRVESAVSDWGNEIFHEINQSLEDSQSNSSRAMRPHSKPAITHRAPPPHEYDTRSNVSPNATYPHHASTRSDSSSIYSSTNPAHRHLSRPLSPDFKPISIPTSTLSPSTGAQTEERNRESPVLVPGNRRGSDSSSHQPAVSTDTTASGSHRNTRELGDFYDSYWRQSTQGPSITGRGNEMGRPSQSAFLATRGVGDSSKDGKRPGQLDFQVTTIAEVETPLASPMPGTAL